MQKRKYVWQNFLLSNSILISLAFFTLDGSTVNGQVITTEKCVELTTCVENFYKECYNDTFRNSFAPRIFDEFGIIDLEDEMARTDNFSLQLKNNPEAIGYIVVYGGRVNKFGELDERPKRLTQYLINKVNINPKRIRVIQGGFREKFEFELWISTVKDSFPPLSPTVNVEMVIFKGKMKPLHTDIIG